MRLDATNNRPNGCTLDVTNLSRPIKSRRIGKVGFVRKKSLAKGPRPITSIAKLTHHSQNGGPLDLVGITVECSPRSSPEVTVSWIPKRAGVATGPQRAPERTVAAVSSLLDARVAYFSPCRERKREEPGKRNTQSTLSENNTNFVSSIRRRTRPSIDRRRETSSFSPKSQRDFWAQSKRISRGVIETERVWRAEIRNGTYYRQFPSTKKLLCRVIFLGINFILRDDNAGHAWEID